MSTYPDPSTYPDHDDLTAAKRGSDHDRAEAWRIIALDERRRADREHKRAEMWKRMARAPLEART